MPKTRSRQSGSAPLTEYSAKRKFGATPEPWQREVLDYYDSQRNPDQYAIRISIASGHGVGKTTLLSWLVIHHCLTLYPQKTAITAPSAPQSVLRTRTAAGGGAVWPGP